MNLNLNAFFKIIGLILMVIGLSMLPSFFVSLIYDDASVYVPFLITLTVSSAVGIFLFKICKKSSKALRTKDKVIIITMCLMLSAILGAIPFIASGSIPNIADAFFESCSGISTTGATILEDAESLPRGILFWRSFMQWMGGIGILLFAIAFMPSLGISGQNISTSDPTGSATEKTKAQISTTAKTLIFIYTFFTILEIILLLIGGMGLYDSLIHTLGTVGTGGFSSYNNSIASFDSTYIRIVITAFMVLCGVNFNLYYRALRRGMKSILADTEFKLYIFVLAASSVFIFAALLITGTYTSVKDAAMDSAFQVASVATTTGYTTADYETWPIICQFLLLILMFFGGCSASTSGGLKLIRMLVILKLIRKGVAQRLHPNAVETVKIYGRKMPSDTVTAITNHIFLYIVMVFTGAFLISIENADLITCFSSVITCLGNVGTGFGLIGPTETFANFTIFSKFILSIGMIAGRLELYTFFILLTPRFWNQNR